ncbi:MAG: hypothetical protein JXB19_12455 [Bacteroidales bacterium]|nr:hypothetical protein [Bacteroidales bacterium]
MGQDVIAVFDIGKTNKKVLLFDRSLSLVFQDEQIFEEIRDDDGFACDDIEKIEKWMGDTIGGLSGRFNIKAVNFTTYGATLVYLDHNGKRLTPVYNYLKPMPEGVLDNFYEKYGGMEAFCRQTASPALGMLNSGLQVLWLKRKKPGVFSKVNAIVHLPQYMSYCFTGQITSEYTSIGCHTALWDFDHMKYHRWLSDEKIKLPEPESNSKVHDVQINGKTVGVGTGIHDSSASLVPYLKGTGDPFILMSTGTWCIIMNPFNYEPLTAEQLKRDTLCYMSVNQKQVKSSRLFMGHMHDVNVKRLAEHFGVDAGSYKKVKPNDALLPGLADAFNGERMFFSREIPEDYIDRSVDLGKFSSFDEAYHQLITDLVSLCMESLELVTAADDRTKSVFISGGFARNEIFVKLIASALPEKKVYTSEIDNATAMGTAITIWEAAFGEQVPALDLGLMEIIKH